MPILYQAMQRSAEARDDVLTARILNTLVGPAQQDRRLAEAESVQRSPPRQRRAPATATSWSPTG